MNSSITADQDLGAQQAHLSSTSHDMRISNLARFIFKKIRDSRLRGNDNTTVISERNKMTSRESLSLLDVGAGNGLFLKFFKAHGFQVSGYELEKENVTNMKKDPVLKNETILQGDITKMSGNEDFDLVIASDVIEHIKDDVLAIKNLWSFVKPGGMMLITVPAHAHLYGKRDEKWGHFRRYDMRVLLDHIEKGVLSYVIPAQAGISRSMDPSGKPQDDNIGYHIAFATQWNIVGYFVYFLFEKILHKPINEKMRYSPTLAGRISRYIVEKILHAEELIGGLPLGLTLVVGVRKV